MARGVAAPDRRRRGPAGVTLVEILVAVALVATIVIWAVPAFIQFLHQTRMDLVVSDIRMIEGRIWQFATDFRRFPDSLDDLEGGPYIDRWGHPYRYLAPTDPGWQGQFRRDRFLVPLNTDFDLYSMGPDGESRPPLTARQSRDDVVRANNGSFVGPAAEF